MKVKPLLWVLSMASLITWLDCLRIRQHQQIVASLSVYVQELQQLQSSIGKDISNIKQYLQSMNAVGDQQQRISILEQTLLTVRQQLIHALPDTFIPINQTQWTCQTIPPQDQLALTKLLQNSNQNLQHIQNLLSTSKINSSFSTAGTTSIAAISMNDEFSKTLNAVGGASPSGTQLGKSTNLLSPSWVVPNTVNSSQLDIIASNYISSKDKLVIACPLDRPFLDKASTCIACSQYFNIVTLQCMNCIKFDSTGHVCNDSPLYNATNYSSTINKIITNSSAQLPVNAPSDVICPPVTPYFDGTTCINCPSLFDLSLRKCSNCPSNSLYNGKTLKCQPIMITVTNTKNLTGILLPVNVTANAFLQNELGSNASNTKSCPESSPFFDGKECLSCSSGLYFSIESKSCETCPSNEIYNPSTYHCQKIEYYSNLGNPSWTSIKNPANQLTNQINQNSTLSNARQCPTSTPFFNNVACIACNPPNNIFSYDSLSCTVCSSGTLFSEGSHSCQSATQQQTNPSTAPNLILDGKSKNQWQLQYYNSITKNPSLSDCPASAPYYDGVTCINCPQTQPYFNLQYKKCQTCPADTKYDSNISDCLADSGNIVTQQPTLEKLAAGIFA